MPCTEIPDQRSESESQIVDETNFFNSAIMPKPAVNLGKFECPFCQRRFFDKYHLKRHERLNLYTNDKSFKCSFCPNRVRVKDKLLVHKQVHKQEPIFKCQHCSLTFTQQDKLELHERTHTGNKPHKESFSQKDNLQLHDRRHAKETPFTCCLCQKSFNGGIELIAHEREYDLEKPFVCVICSAGFRRKDHLQKHLKVMHRIESMEENVEDTKMLNLSPCSKSFQMKTPEKKDDTVTRERNRHNIKDSFVLVEKLKTENLMSGDPGNLLHRKFLVRETKDLIKNHEKLISVENNQKKQTKSVQERVSVMNEEMSSDELVLFICSAGFEPEDHLQNHVKQSHRIKGMQGNVEDTEMLDPSLCCRNFRSMRKDNDAFVRESRERSRHNIKDSFVLVEKLNTKNLMSSTQGKPLHGKFLVKNTKDEMKTHEKLVSVVENQKEPNNSVEEGVSVKKEMSSDELVLNWLMENAFMISEDELQLGKLNKCFEIQDVFQNYHSHFRETVKPGLPENAVITVGEPVRVNEQLTITLDWKTAEKVVLNESEVNILSTKNLLHLDSADLGTALNIDSDPNIAPNTLDNFCEQLPQSQLRIISVTGAAPDKRASNISQSRPQIHRPTPSAEKSAENCKQTHQEKILLLPSKKPPKAKRANFRKMLNYLKLKHKKLRGSNFLVRSRCLFCEKHFHRRSLYIQHKKLHKSIKPCTGNCRFCSRRFPSKVKKQDLENHEKLHFKSYSMVVEMKKLQKLLQSEHKKNRQKQTKTRKAGKNEWTRVDSANHQVPICHVKKSSHLLTGNAFASVNLKPCEVLLTPCDKLVKKKNETNEMSYPFRSETANNLAPRSEDKLPTKGNLEVYKGVHSGEKPYACNFCQLRFRQQSYLKIHERVHTGEKPYECNFCKKRFSQKGNLQAHERLHTEKPYNCNFCNKRFNRKNNLKAHERLHPVEKPYACNLCKKQFAFQRSLQRHVRVHTGEKPHECKVCHKRFRRRYHLKRHEKVHTGDKKNLMLATSAKKSLHFKHL